MEEDEIEEHDFLDFILNEVMDIYSGYNVPVHDAITINQIVSNILSDLHKQKGCGYDFTETHH